MEQYRFEDNDFSVITYENNNLSENMCLRCPQCYQIPFISIENEYKNEKLVLHCPNSHKYKEDFKKLYEKSKNSQIDSIECECGDNDLEYCPKCCKFFCEKNLHRFQHYTIPIEKIDYICYNNNCKYSAQFYCFQDNKNICEYCKNKNHNGHSNEEIEFLKKNKIDDLQYNIYEARSNLSMLEKKIKSFIKELCLLVNYMDNEFKRYKEVHEIEFKMLQDLLNIYKYKSDKKELNYQIIYNLKNNFQFEEVNDFLDINLLEKIKTKFDSKMKKYLIKSLNSVYNSIKTFKNTHKKNTLSNSFDDYDNFDSQFKNDKIQNQNPEKKKEIPKTTRSKSRIVFSEKIKWKIK